MNLLPTTIAVAISAAFSSLALAQSTTILPEVEVRASSVATDVEIYRPSQVGAATRFDADVLAVPQSSQSITAEQISDMGARQMHDVLDVMPSAGAGNTRLAPFASASWTIRGLDASVTRNGFSQLYFEDVDSSALRNVARIDVVKGPGAAAQGQEGLGGVISVTTLRPEKTFAASADVSVGSYQSKVAGFDVTGALGESGLAVRLNGEIEDSGSFVAQQDVERKNVALALSFDNGSPVRGFLNAEYQQRDSMPHPGLPTVGTIFSNGVATIDRGTYLGEANIDYLKSYAPLVQAWLDVDLAEGWTLSPRFQWFEFNVEQQQVNLRNTSPANPLMVARSGRYDFEEHDVMQTWQLELKGKLNTGSVQHQLAAGLESKHAKSGGSWYNYAPGAMPAMNTLDPHYLNTAPARSKTLSTFDIKSVSTEAYVQNLSKITDSLNILAGLRWINLKNDTPELENQDSRGVSYQVGASWEFMPTWSVFSGVSSGMSAAEDMMGMVSADGSPFVPTESRQFEVGFKHQSSVAAFSASLFDVRLLNAVTSDPNNPDYQVQKGEHHIQGLELEGGWQATRSLYLSSGFAWMDGEISQSNDGDVGNKLGNLPKLKGNLWAKYALLDGVSVNGGVVAVGSRYGTSSNTYRLPGYAKVNLGATWNVSRHWQLDLDMSNLLDKVYYSGRSNSTIYPGEPRTAWLKVAAKL